MSATEIYLCKAGQSIKQGRMEVSDSITTKAEAEKDAKARCSDDSSLAKIVYYAISDDGDFKAILTYNNPDADPEAEKGAAPSSTPVKRRQAPKKKLSLMDKIVNAVSGGGKKKKPVKKKPASKKKR